MKMQKSQLKEAIKSIARECLNERHDGGQRAKIQRVVEFVVRKAPSTKRNAQKLAEAAGQLFKKQFGVVANPNLLMEAAYKVVAPKMATDAKEDKARRIQHEPKVNETQTLLPNKGQYKTVAPHAYTTADQNKALTVQSDPEVNEGGNWIQKAVKHPGRCAHMGSPQCPEGSPQYNLAKRFKKGDIHKANLEKECGTCDEMGLTSETDLSSVMGCEPCGEEGHDEHSEIMLLKVIKLAADKLEAMHQDMPGADEPVSLPPEVGDEPSMEEPFAEPDGDEPFGEPEKPSTEEPSEEEPSAEEPSDEPKDEEPPFKKKKEKKEDDPTEFTKKLAKENHKVQKRSYATSNDTPANPKNVRDPNIPMT
jgi:hypothetical protein